MKALMKLLTVVMVLGGCVRGGTTTDSTCAATWRETQQNITEHFAGEVLCSGISIKECECNVDAPFGGARSIKEWTCSNKRILEEYLPGAGIFIVREVVYPFTLESNKGLPLKVTGDAELEACYASKVNYAGCTLTDVRLYCVK